MVTVKTRKIEHFGVLPDEWFVPHDISFNCRECTERDYVDFDISEMVQVTLYKQYQESVTPYNEGDNPFDNCTISENKNYCINCVDDVMKRFQQNPELPEFDGAIGATTVPFTALFIPIERGE